MESHAVYVSQAEVFADLIARVIAGPHREFDAQRAAVHRLCSDVFKFTRLCFPSDSSGQFNPDDHLAKPKANNMDLELGQSQRKSAASAS